MSKKWKSFIESLRPTELIVERKRNLLALLGELWIDETVNRNQDSWFNTDKQINLRNRIFVSKFSALHLFPFSLGNLKFLRVSTKICVENSLPILNALTGLEHLEAFDLALNCKKTDQQALLVLPSLKTLFVKNLDWDNLSRNRPKKYLQIDAVRLKALRSNSELKLIKLIHPNTIEHLEIEFYHNDDLSTYQNVNYFKCDSCITLNTDILERLPALDELHCDEVCTGNRDDYFEMESIIDGIIQQRVVLDRERVKLYHNGRLLDVGRQKFRDYGFYRDYGLNYTSTASHTSDDSSSTYTSSLNSSSGSSFSTIHSSILEELILSDSSFSSIPTSSSDPTSSSWTISNWTSSFDSSSFDSSSSDSSSSDSSSTDSSSSDSSSSDSSSSDSSSSSSSSSDSNSSSSKRYRSL